MRKIVSAHYSCKIQPSLTHALAMTLTQTPHPNSNTYPAHMQNRVPNSQRYLVNANLALTIALTLLTLMVTVSGNPNPTNPTTKYRYH